MAFTDVYDALEQIKSVPDIAIQLAFNIIMIVFGALVFAYWILCIIFTFCCLAKGVDGKCLRFWRMIMPITQWLLITANLAIMCIAFGNNKIISETAFGLEDIEGCIPDIYL